MNRILLIVFVVALAALPLVPATPEFWVTQLNYIGLASRWCWAWCCSPAWAA